jgi:hypothetical protein
VCIKFKYISGYTYNTDRIAEVWLDDYKKYYYRATGNRKNRKFGDISERLEIKKRANCKDFQWFLDNVYPMYEIPEKLRDPTTVATTKTTKKAATPMRKKIFKAKNVTEVTKIEEN